MIEYENLALLNKPYETAYKQVFEQVLQSGWFILGNQVKQFEAEFASFTGANYCLGVASGLDALELAIQAIDLEKGSEIIVPSNTYIATILAVLNNGHIPVFAEPDEHTYNISPESIAKKITRKTKAVMVVHLYGKTCQMDKISDLCKAHKLYLLEDCAQSHGAMFKGQQTGTFGDIAAFSFYPTKNLGALGDSGAITTNNLAFYERIQKLRNYGSSVKYYNEFIGTNSRLDEVQAAFLSVKLKHLNEITAHKRKLAAIYLENLKPAFKLPQVHPDFFDVYHIFNILHPERNKLREYLLENGIKTEIHYPVAPHKQQALAHMNHESYPISEHIHHCTLSLPVSTIHSEDDVRKVVEVMNKF